MSQVVLTEIHGRVGLIRINRPEAMNALNNEVVDGIGDAIDAFEADENIGCIVITGNEKAFAAGADIGFMKDFDYLHAYKTDFITRNWERIKTTRKPVIAAVSGFALGGGCEMAMMCDMIYAADTAKFGQPEIRLGTLPGAGGTQRLPRAVGKAKAMDLCLTARFMDATEAEKAGLVSRIVPADKLVDEALAAAYELNRLDGILPALESAHALAALHKLHFQPSDIVVVTLSGRGDKDMETYLQKMGDGRWKMEE